MARGAAVPRPTALRVLYGAKTNPDEPIAREEPPPRPVWLTPYAAEEWDRIVPELLYMKIIKAADAAIIASYCEAYARLRAATEDIATHGQICEWEGVRSANASVRHAEAASVELRQSARELGLTPSARSGIHVTHHKSDAPAERLLGP
jgi:P27 family predicted phage terminase small subunit